MKLIVVGIIDTLTIWNTSIASIYFGNKTGIIIGEIIIPIPASPTEDSIVTCFNFLFGFPVASWGSIY